jgi:hypothetical protein
MSKQIDDLTAAVATLKTQVVAAVANEKALKAALDAAIANGLSAADVLALQTATGEIQSASQTLADATAVNAPSN